MAIKQIIDNNMTSLELVVIDEVARLMYSQKVWTKYLFLSDPPQSEVGIPPWISQVAITILFFTFCVSVYL